MVIPVRSVPEPRQHDESSFGIRHHHADHPLLDILVVEHRVVTARSRYRVEMVRDVPEIHAMQRYHATVKVLLAQSLGFRRPRDQHCDYGNGEGRTTRAARRVIHGAPMGEWKASYSRVGAGAPPSYLSG